MKKTRRIMTVAACIAACAVSAAGVAACGGGSGDDEMPSIHMPTYNVYMPDGAPAIALAKLMDSGFERAEFTVVNASVIGQRVSSGTADLAIMPVNAAAKLYGSGKDIVMLTVNTHGNLYMIGGGSGIDVADLAGCRIGVIGIGNVPDLTLRMMLAESGVSAVTDGKPAADSVSLVYAADGLSLAPLIKQGAVDYAFLAEPAATTLSGNLGKSIVMDAQEQWENIFGGEYPQACLIAKGDIVRDDGMFISQFIAAVKASDGWAEQNADKTVEVISAHMEKGTEPTLTSLTADVIKRCNIKTVSASESKSSCKTYFEKLAALNTVFDEPVLPVIPDDGFYYRF